MAKTTCNRFDWRLRGGLLHLLPLAALALLAADRALVVRAGVTREPTVYVLAVGVNQYPQLHSYVTLRGAVPDAKAIAAAFGYSVGFYGGAKVRLLLDSEATVASVRGALADIAREAHPEDFVILYIGGHGMGKETQARLPRGETDYRFVFSDAREADMLAPITNTLGAKELSTLLLSIQSTRQMVIFDTSHSSEAFESLQQALNSDSVFTIHDTGRRFALLGVEGFAPERSFVRHGVETVHGLLTQVLLDGMEGAADANGDGALTEEELEAYAMAHLPMLDRGMHLVSYSDLRGLCLAVTKGGAGCDTGYGYDPRISVAATTRGITAVDEEPARKAALLGTDYALVVAGDDYEQWPKLNNPIYDAQTLVAELESNYGYAPDHVRILKNPTKIEIFDRLTELKKQTFRPHDRLLVYVAGHGFMEGDEGFVVTHETKLPSDDPYLISGLELSRLRDMINSLPVPHILVVLDVCYGGVFKEQKLQTAYSIANLDSVRPVDEMVDLKMQHVSRMYVASGGLRKAFDGEPGRHSPFARTFLGVLRRYGGPEHLVDMGKIDGAVVGLCPHPYIGTFGVHEPEGDFVFVPSDHPQKVPDAGLEAHTPAPACHA